VVVERSSRRAAALVEVAGNGEGAGHAPGQPAVLGVGEVLDRVHMERGRVAGDLSVREIAVPELRERVVANREHPRREALARLNREVPRLVEAPAPDARVMQLAEDPVVPATLRALRRRQGLAVPEL